MSVRGERVEIEAWSRGDRRPRCEEGHVLCEGCGDCACATDLDTTEFPSGTLRVTKDKQGRSLCRECRYQIDVLGN